MLKKINELFYGLRTASCMTIDITYIGRWWKNNKIRMCNGQNGLKYYKSVFFLYKYDSDSGLSLKHGLFLFFILTANLELNI